MLKWLIDKLHKDVDYGEETMTNEECKCDNKDTLGSKVYVVPREASFSEVTQARTAELLEDILKELKIINKQLDISPATTAAFKQVYEGLDVL